jgi:hypothetical protein
MNTIYLHIKQIFIVVGLLLTHGVSLSQSTPCDIPIVINVQSQDPLCYGDANGWIDLDISGGTPAVSGDPYEIRWNKNDYNGQSLLSGLNTGNYEVVIVDSVGCTQSTMITLEAPPEIIINETHISPSFSAPGAIDLSVSGGVGNYLYEWSNGATTEDINNLQAGTYQVIVTDDNGCEMEETIQLNLINIIQSGNFNFTTPVYSASSTRLNNDQVILAPNPSPGNVKITWENMTVVKIRIIANNGTYDNTFKVDSSDGAYRIENIPTGFYTVRLITDNATIVQKTLNVIQ